MIKKVFTEVPSFFQRIKRNAAISWEAYLPSRQSLLKSLWNSDEKGSVRFCALRITHQIGASKSATNRAFYGGRVVGISVIAR